VQHSRIAHYALLSYYGRENRCSAGKGKHLQTGDLAPDMTVTIEDKQVRLRDFVGEQRVVLYFYPKDSTPSCTLEARGFNDLIEQFATNGAVVIGVSTDDVTSHARFARREGLRFSLGTDPDGTLATAFGAANRLVQGIVAKRVTFLIERDGRIARVWDRVNPHTHPLDVLDAVRALNPTCPCCPEGARARFPTGEGERYGGVIPAK